MGNGRVSFELEAVVELLLATGCGNSANVSVVAAIISTGRPVVDDDSTSTSALLIVCVFVCPSLELILLLDFCTR